MPDFLLAFLFFHLAQLPLSADQGSGGSRLFTVDTRDQVEAPGLSVQQVGGEVVLSWSATVQGYRLKSVEVLGRCTGWSPIPTLPTVVDFRNVLTDAIAGSTRFYRLRRE